MSFKVLTHRFQNNWSTLAFEVFIAAIASYLNAQYLLIVLQKSKSVSEIFVSPNDPNHNALLTENKIAASRIEIFEFLLQFFCRMKQREREGERDIDTERERED